MPPEERKPLPNAGMKPEDKKMLDKLATAIASATGEKEEDVLKKFMDQAKAKNGSAALDAAMKEYAELDKAGKVKAPDKKGVDDAAKANPLMAGRLLSAVKAAGGAAPAPARPGGAVPKIDMKPADKELFDKLVTAVSNATGEKAEDIVAATAGKRGEEQMRSAIAQYAMSEVKGDIAAADKVDVGALRKNEMAAALKAAKTLNDAPKGVKDNLNEDEKRKAVILAMKDPQKFKTFVDAVKDAGGDRAKQKAAAEALKEVLKKESIAMALPEREEVRVASVSGGASTHGPAGGRQMTGMDATRTTPETREV